MVAAALLAAAGPARADQVFSDGFESGDFSAWSLVQTGGDGKAVVQSAFSRTGLLAAQLSESSGSGSKAYLRETFSSVQQDLTASADFLMQQEGAKGGNVPLFRFLDPSSARVVSLYRQNATGGKIGVGYGGGHVTTAAKLPLGTWANLSLHVVPAGAASTVEVRLNGALIYQTSSANLGAAAGISTIQLGNDTASQAFGIVVDTVDVQNASGSTTPSPPVNTVPPSISGIPQSGQTLSAATGTWTGTLPIGYAFQWQRCDATGGGCSTIDGANGAAYAAGSDDVGDTLRVVVTATNAVGSASATSPATAIVAASSSPPVSTSPPTITGGAQSGQTLTAGQGAWSGSQPIAFAYQWQRCDASGDGCSPLEGATASTYSLTAADVGTTLRVVVTAINAVDSASATSAPTAVVQPDATPAGLVALWHMDETSGNVMNDAVGGHTGTLYSVALGQPGALGTAYGFTGKSWVSVPSAPDLNPGAADITITIRLKSTSVPAKPDWDIIRKGLYTSSGGEYKMEYQPSGQASCGFKGSGGYSELMAGPAINDGQWHTVQCVKTATQIKVVVDGQAFTKSAKLGSIGNTVAVPIGARPGSEYFKGSLDEASIQIG